MQDFFVGCAGRLPGVRERMAREKLQHLLFGGRIQYIFCGEFLGMNVIRGANARGGRSEVVVRVAKFNAGVIAEAEAALSSPTAVRQDMKLPLIAGARVFDE